MRIVFFNRFYAPDHAATAQLLSDVAEHLAIAGREVIVVTSRAVYDDDHRLLPAREVRHGVTVVRTWTPKHRGGMAGRLIAYLAYYVTALVQALRLAGKDTVFVVKTDPPLLSLVIAIGARRGTRVVHWVQDLFPEVAEAFGMRLGGGSSGALFRFLRDWSFRRAIFIVAIGQLMAQRIASTGIPPERIRVIPNWTDDAAITPVPSRMPALRDEWDIASDAFVLEYSGNLGRAHEYDTVFGAAQRLRDRPDIIFLFIGGGHMARQLAARVAADGLTSFRFLPYQPRERLAASIVVGDAHWVSLRPEFEGLIVPSKVFGICAAGRPLLAICASDGEVPRMLLPDRACVNVAPGDVEALAAAITSLAADKSGGDAIGAAGRSVLERHYRQAQALGRWQALLDEIAADGARPSH